MTFTQYMVNKNNKLLGVFNTESEMNQFIYDENLENVSIIKYSRSLPKQSAHLEKSWLRDLI